VEQRVSIRGNRNEAGDVDSNFKRPEPERASLAGRMGQIYLQWCPELLPLVPFKFPVVPAGSLVPPQLIRIPITVSHYFLSYIYPGTERSVLTIVQRAQAVLNGLG
jgi:hypothetical protein